MTSDEYSSRIRMHAWLRDRHACESGREWADEQCVSIDDCWNKARPDWLFWAAKFALSQDELAAFLYSCVRHVRPFIEQPALLHILELFKRRAHPTGFGGPRVTQQDVYNACKSAKHVFSRAINPGHGRRTHLYNAAMAISGIGVSCVDRESVDWATHYSAAALVTASGASENSEDYIAAKQRFARYLRKNFKPNWERIP